jgi:hypothetical protein
MKTYNEFTQAVVENIRSNGYVFFPSEYDVEGAELQTVNKNNTTCVAVRVRKGENKVSPIVYLEPYYEKYRSCEFGMYDVCKDIANVIIANDDVDIDVDDIINLDKVRDHILCRIVGIKGNEEYLSNKPYTKVSDLAAMYYVDLGDGKTVPITNNILEGYKITKRRLHDIALKNLTNSGLTFKSMRDVLLEMGAPEEMLPEDNSINMYVLTNKSKVFGAAAILDKATMEGISKQVGGDFIIIPSSVHEVIILPMSADVDGLNGIIKDVNANEVEEQDRLSNHPYIYNSKTGNINIA